MTVSTGNNFWIPNPASDSWIQVDLGLSSPVVTGVIVQGYLSYYVSTFSVQYSDDTESWKDLVYIDGDTIQVINTVGESIGVQ